MKPYDDAWEEYEAEIRKNKKFAATEEEIAQHKNSFVYGWLCASNEATQFITIMGQHGIANLTRDHLHGDWLDEEEVEDE
jgi:hypothetical protein